jgi:hypothetical protein
VDPQATQGVLFQEGGPCLKRPLLQPMQTLWGLSPLGNIVVIRAIASEAKIAGQGDFE